MFTCLFSLIFGTLGMASASVIVPDLGKAAVSLEKVIEILEADYAINA